jgi:hypothetical protein
MTQTDASLPYHHRVIETSVTLSSSYLFDNSDTLTCCAYRNYHARPVGAGKLLSERIAFVPIVSPRYVENTLTMKATPVDTFM